MATTIVPATGAAPIYTQGGVGASPGYAALDFRRADSPGLQAGVMNGTDFKVVQRGAGANMSVDITMNSTGQALVQGASISNQGLYSVPCHSATINEAIAVAHATLPRLDRVYLRVFDTTHDSSGLSRAETAYQQGTATAGATHDNPVGAPSAPAGGGSWLLLADVLVGSAATSVVTVNIRDRRLWAKGAFWMTSRTSGTMTTSSGTFVEMDTTLLKPRLELSGYPVRVAISGSGYQAGGTNAAYLGLFVDGVQASGSGRLLVDPPTAGKTGNISTSWVLNLSAGSHTFSPAFLASSGSANIISSATDAFLMTVEEILRPVANNS